MPEMIDGMSMNLEAQNMDKLKSVFPECFAEGTLDIDKLLSLCGEYITNDFEKYKFEWKGKSECLQLAQKRSAGTLRPCPEESVNFDTTQNLYIEGDNLEVLKLLQTAYYRRVKMIYIDPPYNTGNDFVYEDDFADPIQRYKEVTQQTTKSNPETMGRYHTNWLNMMYPRLRLAANLLRDDGVIFVSIDDNEVTNLRKICDEVFGEENFVAKLVWQKRTSPANDAQYYSSDHEYILVYAKNKTAWFPQKSKRTEEQNKYYTNPDNDTRGSWNSATYTCNKSRSERPTLYYPIINPNTNEEIYPDENAVWKFSRDKHEENVSENLLYWGADGKSKSPRLKQFLSEAKDIVPRSVWPYTEVGSTQSATTEIRNLFDGAAFPYPKPVGLIKKAVYQGTSGDDIILDFFSGSATTAHAVMQLNAEDGGNRQFILVQLPEVCDENSEAYKAGYKNICEIGKERIRRAGARIVEEQADLLGWGRQQKVNPEQQVFASWVTSDETVKRQDEIKKVTDVGFKVFKLDTSNLKTWDATPIADDDLPTLYDRMSGMVNRVKPDRSDMDMVFEVMLKLGVPLSYGVTEIKLNSKAAYTVGDNSLLLICLAQNVQPEDVEQMTKYTPAKVIIARDSFKDDTAMSNAYYILRDRGIELKLV